MLALRVCRRVWGHGLPRAAALGQRHHRRRTGRRLAHTTSPSTSSSPSPSDPHAIATISYITDVEGNLEYLKGLVSRSPVLSLSAEELLPGAPHLQLADNTAFVFGGDCFDKGPGDIRVSRMLVDLKERHPGRVHLLCGNRDSGKTKLWADLDPGELGSAGLAQFSTPYWLPKRYFLSAAGFMDKFGLEDSQLSRLRYMLSHHLGCLNTFELRREELAAIGRSSQDAISDAQVLASFVEGMVDPSGFYRQYVAHAVLGVTIGNTLFVHGAVTKESMGFVPDLGLANGIPDGPISGTEMKDTHSCQEWIEALNRFKAEAFAELVEQPLFREGAGGRRRRGGEALMGYCHRLAVSNRTVMVMDFTANGHMQPAAPEVEAYLAASGIHRVVVGHKPVGDSPVVVRRQTEVIACDTSFSDPAAPNKRGCAASELLIVGGPEHNQARVHGVLASGEEIDFTLPPPANGGPGDAHIGWAHPAQPDWLIKARLREPGPCGKSYVAVKTQGFDVEYQRWHPGD